MEETKKPINWHLIFTLFSVTIGSSYVFGFNVGVMNAPAALITKWIQNHSYPEIHQTDLSNHGLIELWSWIVSVFILAGSVGGLLCGYAADKLGRKKAMMVNDLVTISGAIVLGVSKMTNAYYLLFIGRFILGVSCGVSSGLGPMYLTELAPLRLRGLFGCANSLLIEFGFLTSQALALPELLGTEKLWPVLLSISGIPAILQLICLPFCPESPKYLLLIKQTKPETNKALVFVSKTNDVTQEVNSLLEDVTTVTKQEENSSKISSRRLYWWGITICVALHISQQVSGATAVVYFSTSIFRENAMMENEQAIGASLGIGVTLFIACLCSTVTVERVGRRFLMIIGLIGTFVSNIVIFAALHLLAIDSEAYQSAAYVAVISVYVFILAFAVGPASVPWYYVSELFEPSKRARANTIASMFNWFSSFLMGLAFLPMKEVMGEFVFLLFAGLVALCLVFVYFLTPETKGRESKEIAKELEERMPRCLKN